MLAQRVVQHRVFPEGTVFLSPRKKRVLEINTHFLNKLQTTESLFVAEVHGEV